MIPVARPGNRSCQTGTSFFKVHIMSATTTDPNADLRSLPAVVEFHRLARLTPVDVDGDDPVVRRSVVAACRVTAVTAIDDQLGNVPTGIVDAAILDVLGPVPSDPPAPDTADRVAHALAVAEARHDEAAATLAAREAARRFRRLRSPNAGSEVEEFEAEGINEASGWTTALRADRDRLSAAANLTTTGGNE